MNVQCELLTARDVPVTVPPGAEEFTGQPWIIVQKVKRGRVGDVINDRTALKIILQPHLPTQARLFRQLLTENEPSRG